MLTNQIKKRILQPLISLCEHSKTLEQQLNKNGFWLFSDVQQFEGAFACVASHYQFMQEVGKETLGSFDGSLAYVFGETASGYRSPYLAELCHKRDEKNGIPFSEYRLNCTQPWKLEIDSSRMARLKLQLEHPILFNEKKQKFDQEFNHKKALEALVDKNAATGQLRVLDGEQKLTLLKSIIEQQLTPIGFEFSKRYSAKTYPVYAKPINGKFSLCCGIKNADDTFLQSDRGFIDLVFHLREKSFKKAKVAVSPYVEVKDHDKFLIFHFSEIIPYFSHSYSHFTSIATLAHNIKAQAVLFELVYSQFESHLKNELDLLL